MNRFDVKLIILSPEQHPAFPSWEAHVTLRPQVNLDMNPEELKINLLRVISRAIVTHLHSLNEDNIVDINKVKLDTAIVEIINEDS